MARPSKSVHAMSKNLTKEEREARLNAEERLKGNSNKILPPDYLNERQGAIFNYIVEEMRASEILGNLDIYVLSTCAIAIDRLQGIESLINEEPTMMFDRAVMSAKDKYTKDFFRCTNELSLSPQSRAKLGVINVQTKQQEEDPLLKLLAGGKK